MSIEKLETELLRRDVQAPIGSLLLACSLEQIAKTIDWWDHISTGAGPGVLVDAIRKGGVSDQRQMLDSQREYGEQICEQLNRLFPEMIGAQGRPHPAAIVAVVHLHHEHGKGRLTKREHGPRIRAAVKAWEKKWAVAGQVAQSPRTSDRPLASGSVTAAPPDRREAGNDGGGE